MNDYRWGIDLGGTKIECLVLAENKSILYRDRIPTEGSQGYEHIIDQVKKLVAQAKIATKQNPRFIGICTPGSTDQNTGLLRNSNTTALNGKPFLNDLAIVLDVKVGMENDANCFALAEHFMGSVAELNEDVTTTFGIILGTGVGGGIVHSNKLITGYNGIAGEWGHNYLDASGGLCYCGKVGCVEKIISGPSLEKFYQEKSGERKSLKDIYSEHLEGTNPDASATIDRLIHFFGIGISQVINIIDPDVIIIGGGVGNINCLYTRGLESAIQNIFSPSAKCKIIKPKLGDSAGVFGAAFIEA